MRGARFVEGVAVPEGGAAVVDGERLEGDRVIWAGGAWLARLFPDLVQLTVTRQEVFFFGAPAGWQAPNVPAWVDFDAGIYGVGDVDARGFKVAPDEHGPEFDPDADDRIVSADKERVAREYLGRRFPALAQAPLVGTRACPYSLTPDQNFLIAPHPEHESVWLLGGGSGHGFKHGPALAEHVEGLLSGRRVPGSPLRPRRPKAERRPENEELESRAGRPPEDGRHSGQGLGDPESALHARGVRRAVVGDRAPPKGDVHGLGAPEGDRGDALRGRALQLEVVQFDLSETRIV